MIEGAVKTNSGNWYLRDDPGEMGSNVPRLSICESEIQFITSFCKDKMVLEIGTGTGISAISIAKVAKMVVTVDPDPWVQENVWPSLPENVIGLSSLLACHTSRSFDVCFIDGEHTFAACTHDIQTAKKSLREGGIVIFHDTNLESVRKALRWAKINTVEMFSSPCGVLVGTLAEAE